MKIKYSDLAIIIQAIRNTEDFDGLDNIDGFMNKLDDMEGSEIEINQNYGVTTFKLPQD